VTAPKDPTDPTDMAAFNKNVIAEFRANDGKVDGVFEEGTMALLHHVAVKSGVERVNPLGYSPMEIESSLLRASVAQMPIQRGTATCWPIRVPLWKSALRPSL